jgi:hypothetical protein
VAIAKAVKHHPSIRGQDSHMPAFVVTILSDVSAVTAQVEKHIPEENRYRLKPDVWLIDYDGTARALSALPGIRDTPNIGTGIVFPFLNYSGRAPKSVWDWLGLHVSREEI